MKDIRIRLTADDVLGKQLHFDGLTFVASSSGVTFVVTEEQLDTLAELIEQEQAARSGSGDFERARGEEGYIDIATCRFHRAS